MKLGAAPLNRQDFIESESETKNTQQCTGQAIGFCNAQKLSTFGVGSSL
jgi:hypothetical protein